MSDDSDLEMRKLNPVKNARALVTQDKYDSLAAQAQRSERLLAQAQAMYKDQRHAYNAQKKIIGELQGEMERVNKLFFDEEELMHKWQHKADTLRAQLKIAVDAIKQSVARSDDYGDSHCSQPIRQALASIEKLREKK